MGIVSHSDLLLLITINVQMQSTRTTNFSAHRHGCSNIRCSIKFQLLLFSCHGSRWIFRSICWLWYWECSGWCYFELAISLHGRRREMRSFGCIISYCTLVWFRIGVSEKKRPYLVDFVLTHLLSFYSSHNCYSLSLFASWISGFPTGNSQMCLEAHGYLEVYRFLLSECGDTRKRQKKKVQWQRNARWVHISDFYYSSTPPIKKNGTNCLHFLQPLAFNWSSCQMRWSGIFVCIRKLRFHWASSDSKIGGTY